MTKAATITARLKEAIRESGLTHYRLSKLSGIVQPVIDRFVAGERDIRLETAERLAFTLCLTLTREGPVGQFRQYGTGKVFDPASETTILKTKRK
jgi:hypothetical protein